MKIKEIEQIMQTLAPKALALDWDNVGLLIGDRENQVNNILLTIDITKEVLKEALRLKTDLIISYHPIIWDGLKKITAQSDAAVVYELIRAGISVYSVHTSLDIATCGVNDALAEMIDLTETEPIGDYVPGPDADLYKFVVFAPVDSVDDVSKAIFEAGAGAIGNYSDCSWQTAGQGSFKPMNGSNPTIGKKGKQEKVPEYRIETVVPGNKLQKAVRAMKNAHPYETPAFDCIKLCNSKDQYGLGRLGTLQKPAKLDEIIQKIKQTTGASAFGIIGPEDKTFEKAAVCAGSCGSIINSVIAQDCDLYITGELKHHLALAAQEAGLTCICLSHTVSERFILKKLASQLENQTQNIKINISQTDKDPFNWKNI